MASRVPLPSALCSSLAPQVAVTVTHQGAEYRVETDFALAVSPATALEVLTDYDHLADFTANMHSSRVVSREPLWVEQKGWLSIFFVHVPINVVLDIEEQETVVRFKAVTGNLKNMRGEWRVEGSRRSIRLVYHAWLDPGFPVLSLLGEAIIRGHVKNMMASVGCEMLRRQARQPGTASKR